MQIQTWTWGPASDICEAEGHIPVREWLSNATDEPPPPGCLTSCLRCGAVLEAETEIPDR